MAQYGIMLAIMQGVSMAVAPGAGWFIDRVNRVTATNIADPDWSGSARQSARQHHRGE
jgi:hypothetical protein